MHLQQRLMAAVCRVVADANAAGLAMHSCGANAQIVRLISEALDHQLVPGKHLATDIADLMLPA